MSDISGSVLNGLFADKMGTAEGKEKIAKAGGDWIRDRLREESFLRSILPPRTVTPDDCQRSTKHDSLVYMAEVEPFSRAMTLSFRGLPDVHYFTAPRFEVPFHSVGSLRYEQREQDLQAYKMPITEMIRKNVVNDIGEVEDRVGLNHFESATQSLQKDANGVAFTATFSGATTKALTAANVAAGTCVESGKCKGIDVIQNTVAVAPGLTEALTFPVQKDDIIKLRKLFTGTGQRGSRLRCNQILMTDTDFEDISSWVVSDVGDKVASETTIDGYKYKTLVNGTSYTKTLKTDILRPGNIYGFAAPEFLGGFLILNKLKFYADKERNMISFEAWEDIGVYVANVTGVRKIELYAGSVDAGVTGLQSTTTTEANATAKTPVAEDKLGKLNNLVEEGQTFPAVSNF